MIAPDEWDTLALLIEEGWPGEFSDATAKAWRILLDDYDTPQVLAAIKLLVARGGTFRPSVAEIAAAIRQDPSQPTFEEAYRLIYGPDGVFCARVSGSFPSGIEMARAQHRAREERARELHPLVASFVLRYGIDRLALLELNDPEWGEARRKELRDAWDRHVRAVEGREVASLVSGRRGEGLRMLDPLSAVSGRRLGLSSGTERIER